MVIGITDHLDSNVGALKHANFLVFLQTLESVRVTVVYIT